VTTPARSPQAFQPRFDCLWCGRPWETRTDQDLEGFARLCPDCVGRAQENEFLRYRLREGLKRRSEAEAGRSVAAETVAAETVAAETVARTSDEELRAYYAARAGEYDDWFLRRGRYSRGAIADAAWAADLDQATLWLDAQPLSGEIVELAAGTGWWSPLLAQKGALWLYDINEEPLDLARQRLLAHGLAAHIHVRDAWAEPDRQVDALFFGFWLSHVPRARLGQFLALCRRWLKPGGRLAFIVSRRDPESGAVDHPQPADDLSVRKLDDGREFTIVKVYWQPDELEDALHAAGFRDTHLGHTSRFFIYGEATAN
jgi:demethylmenaquinone methyltransferase/2-methoxy-6-polyprenyl-1,4-benzoquinol methylase